MTDYDPSSDITDRPPENDPDTAFCHQYNIAEDMREGKTCKAVILALADALDAQPLELPSLHTVVDLDALNQLLCPQRDSHRRATVAITFRYEGYWVTITADGDLRLQD